MHILSWYLHKSYRGIFLINFFPMVKVTIVFLPNLLGLWSICYHAFYTKIIAGIFSTIFFPWSKLQDLVTKCVCTGASIHQIESLLCRYTREYIQQHECYPVKKDQTLSLITKTVSVSVPRYWEHKKFENSTRLLPSLPTSHTRDMPKTRQVAM